MDIISKTSIGDCEWNESLFAQFNEDGQITEASDERSDHPCVSLSGHIELKPSGGGDSVHNAHWNKQASFHPKLVVKQNADNDEGRMWMTFQAKAREHVGIALTPTLQDVTVLVDIPAGNPTGAATSRPFIKNKTYQIVLGARGNTTTIMHRHSKYADISVASRPCSTQDWISYWVCWNQGKLYVGTGDKLGSNCIGVLNDSEHYTQQQLKSSKKISEETKDETMADEKVESEPRRDKKESLGEKVRCYYVGFKNMARTGGQYAGQPMVLRNIVLSSSSLLPQQQQELDGLPTDANEELDVCCVVDDDKGTTKKLLLGYQAQCRTRRARSLKFGTAYEAPLASKLLPWSDVKRLQTTPQPAAPSDGIVTGIDVLSPEELKKQEARKARFAAAAAEAAGNDDVEHASNTAVKDDDAMDTEADGLPVNQAWDKELLLAPHRAHPPESLWIVPSEAEASTITFTLESATPVMWAEDKVHIAAIDWAAFKQIRTKDITAHFSDYGPTYVEWLGDLSANVHFSDPLAAKRALRNLSKELPSPPPPLSELCVSKTGNASNDDVPSDYVVPDLHNCGWRLGRQPMRKIANDRHGRRNTVCRFLLRLATTSDTLEERPSTWPNPPQGFSAEHVMGADSDFFVPKKSKGKAAVASSTVNVNNARSSRDNGRGNSGGNVNSSKRKRGRGDGGNNRDSHSNNDDQNKKQPKEKKSNNGSGNKKKKTNDGKSKKAETAPKEKRPEEKTVDKLSRGLTASRGGFSVEQLAAERERAKASGGN